MNKRDSIARKILGWKLNNSGKWYDFEKGIFVDDSEFQPDQNLNHAMLVVKKLEEAGYKYTIKGDSEVCFHNSYNQLCATGDTLAEAITNAAYLIADKSTLADGWM
nr:hypothetical protein [uncultured Bacillus sp.]